MRTFRRALRDAAEIVRRSLFRVSDETCPSRRAGLEIGAGSFLPVLSPRLLFYGLRCESHSRDDDDPSRLRGRSVGVNEKRG